MPSFGARPSAALCARYLRPTGAGVDGRQLGIAPGPLSRYREALLTLPQSSLLPPFPPGLTTALAVLSGTGAWIALVGFLLALVLGYVVGSRATTAASLPRAALFWAKAAALAQILTLSLVAALAVPAAVLLLLLKSLEPTFILRALGLYLTVYVLALGFALLGLGFGLQRGLTFRAFLTMAALWALVVFALPVLGIPVVSAATLGLLTDTFHSGALSTVTAVTLSDQVVGSVLHLGDRLVPDEVFAVRAVLLALWFATCLALARAAAVRRLFLPEHVDGDPAR